MTPKTTFKLGSRLASITGLGSGIRHLMTKQENPWAVFTLTTEHGPVVTVYPLYYAANKAVLDTIPTRQENTALPSLVVSGWTIQPPNPSMRAYLVVSDAPVPWEERLWRGLDGSACPSCGTQDTRWDGISPDYPGDWWECRNDHRFLLDHDGRTWTENDR